MSDKEFNYTLDLAKVATNKGLMAVTRMLATDIMNSPYMTLGDFFKSISDKDLQTFVDCFDELKSDDYKSWYNDLVVMAELLATSEGLPGSASYDELTSRANQLVGHMLIVSLERKGLVKVHYENLSFGDDMGDKIVVEKLI